MFLPSPVGQLPSARVSGEAHFRILNAECEDVYICSSAGEGKRDEGGNFHLY
jgi:hypothetical protein